ncbi:hypothetical protein GOBAR_AA25297 [Gossypium barbadense]|uniref:Uncharacterized protein n=1 Tax=Gossypium barbadense TaxID=3634 RepID=A0A2P5WWB9_GOSBA|nr:hypothetical protein GOBAR_AA25297 [Gossypium barbadense]
MVNVPSLVSLSIDALKRELIHGDDLLPHVYELPLELFNSLVECLPPLALQKLQSEMPFKNYDDYGPSSDDLKMGRKRGRYGNFDTAWKALFKFRWPDLVECVKPVDWQQIYWETHVQNCLDEAAEIALLPSFIGCLGEIQILENILQYIGYVDDMSNLASDYLKLSYHCQQFGCYARRLRLQNVLCVLESCQLLKKSNLQSLVVQWIRSSEHVAGLCKLLNQNSRTLTSLEFVHCKISSTYMDTICGSLCSSGAETHQIHHFSISSSSFDEIDPVSLAHSLASFLSSGRAILRGVTPESAIPIRLHALSLTISGWLSIFNWKSNTFLSSSGVTKSLQSLRILKLGGNNLQKDDAGNLRYVLVQMPSLEILDLSDNPIEDDGIRSLIPYFAEASKSCSPLTDLNLGSCELSSDGVILLLDVLSTLARPLNYLSLADNGLGSQVAEALGKFWGTSIQVLNLEVCFPVFKYFLNDKAVSMFNAAYNLMPAESLPLICSALKTAKGHVEQVDLRGNICEYQPSHDTMLAEFQHNGKPILILPSSVALNVPYDDDP